MTTLHKFACVFAVASGMLFISNGAFAQGAPLFAVLNGGNECNDAGVCRKGDLPDGFGSATIIFPTATSVCWGIVVDNLNSPPASAANAAHIHRGTSGVNGPVVAPLFPPVPVPPGAGNPGASSGCRGGVDPAVILAIRADPTRFYVNVHNAPFPNGAVRGQLQ